MGLERYEEAASMFRRAAVRNPDSVAPYLNLAVCYGHLGQLDDARQALARLRRVNPDFSLDWMRTFLPFKHEGELDRVVNGLHKAGLEN